MSISELVWHYIFEINVIVSPYVININFQNGFDVLHALIPALSQSPNAKVSKAAMLQKSEYSYFYFLVSFPLTHNTSIIFLHYFVFNSNLNRNTHF